MDDFLRRAHELGFPKPEKYADIERERRWLCSSAPLPEGLDIRIVDRYLVGTRLRLRLMQFSATGAIERKLSKKADLDDMHRLITTISLTSAEYDLLKKLPARELVKQRRRIPCDNGHVSVDQFDGSLHGLRLVEREFLTDEEMRLYQPPVFADIEVTSNPRYSGGALAEHGLPQADR